ncbi:MAG: diaminopimelate decarboxylase [Clostridiaceae bacterium]|nr:diaminopimelate decarboxylase [Clostridiaceae bacterium]
MEARNNELYIGGVGVGSLREKFGTPLYIIDEESFKEKVQIFIDNFKSDKFETRVIYASKAFTNLYMVNLVAELGLYLDVVSGGELYTALKGGMASERIYYHGNNKLYDELEFAISDAVGTIVVDNEYEYRLISKIANRDQVRISILLRVNPGIEAKTHKYIQTAKHDSKFGMSIFNEKTKELIEKMNADKCIDFRGIHCHIGSQIFDEKFFFAAAQAMIQFAYDIETKLNLDIKEINLGGGFGVYYTEKDEPFNLPEFLQKYIRLIEEKLSALAFNVEIISIEPGRSLINNAGSTIYTIGGIKETITGLQYLFVDGGMTDNPRHALYQAAYEAGIANKINDELVQEYTVSGKLCETGDILIKNVMLPEASPGDILVIPSTGSYNYSMSSNYNGMKKPAVVFVKNGECQLAVKRESYDDLIRNDVARK